ncbi:MAG: group II intron reverse transcriptase/maturase [Solirubrobacterales bacterium]
MVAQTAANPGNGAFAHWVPRVKPEAPREERSDQPAPAPAEAHPAPPSLWERAFSRENLAGALRRVEQNAGAPGVDGVKTGELRGWLHDHWPEVRAALEAGTYRPQAVRRVTIPKPSGGERELGVPTALDRMVQQALLQVLTPVFDPGFSGRSFGFRPGRSAHQAVERARRDIAEGFEWAVDQDLDRFFDRVNHDRLLAVAARRVDDKRVLRLIRRYLEAGVMADGVKQPSEEGTPQGSPLSPLLSNVYLDDLDRVLAKRGHRFVRYADDLTIYVRSERAAQRVMESTCEFVERRLKLRVNRGKSSVGSAYRATLLGFGFLRRGGEVKVRVDPKARRRAKGRLRRLSSRRWGVSMGRRIAEINRFTVGWTAYFALADTPRPFEELDEWLRRRLRQVRWKEWKRHRTRRRNLRALGIPERAAREWAGSRKGYWRTAGSAPLQRALPNSYWRKLGLAGFTDPYRRLRDATRAARCGPACRVAWEGPG